MKKFLALMMAGALTLGLLTACGGSDPAPAPDAGGDGGATLDLGEQALGGRAGVVDGLTATGGIADDTDGENGRFAHCLVLPGDEVDGDVEIFGVLSHPRTRRDAGADGEGH